MSGLAYESKDQPSAMLKYDAAAGTGTALFSRYHIEDKDGDVTEPQFIEHQARVPILVSHQWNATPVGKGVIRSTSDAAFVDFTLADTPRGRELAEWLRLDFSGGQPTSQWSYGFTVLPGGSSRRTIDGKSVRVLHGLADGSPGCTVHECSYVLLGAGVGTALVSMKADQRFQERRDWARRYAELTALCRAREEATNAEAHRLYTQFQARRAAMREWRGI